MGLVIVFPLPGVEPATATALGRAERLFLIGGVRVWVAAFRRAADPMPDLQAVMAAHGVDDARLSVDAIMRIAARTVRRSLQVHAPACPEVSGDEAKLLRLAALAQCGADGVATHALCATLLTSPGADMALGSFIGLGRIFKAAGLFFRHKPSGGPTVH